MTHTLTFQKLQNKIPKEGKHLIKTIRENDHEYPSSSLYSETHIHQEMANYGLTENMAIENLVTFTSAEK